MGRFALSGPALFHSLERPCARPVWPFLTQVRPKVNLNYLVPCVRKIEYLNPSDVGNRAVAITLQGITLRQLRALSTTAECGSVAAAARRLHVTPPAVSLQLKQLEAHAGVPLLQRTPDGMRPTHAGQVLLDAAHQIDGILKDSAETLRNMLHAHTGLVRVGVVSTAKYFAPAALAGFREEHREVEMRLFVGNRDATVRHLAEFELDFAIMGRSPQDFPVQRSIIGPHPHVLVCPPDHPLNGRARVQPAELAHETFLMREKGSGTRALTERLIARLDIEPNVGMEIGSNETIKQAVMAGLGVALISAHTVAHELEEGRLSLIRAPGLPMMRQWQVVRRKEKHLLPTAAALWDFLAARGAAYLPRLEHLLG